MITKKQKHLFDFICDFYKREGIIPTYEEMCLATKAKSKGSIHQLLTALEGKGYIRRHKNKARSIEVLKEMPRSEVPYQVSPARIKDNVVPFSLEGAVDVATIPYFGEIAAGTPLDNLYEEAPSELTVPMALLGASVHLPQDKLFALKITGDSMKGAGILDGDIVILKRTKVAKNGEIVAAVVDNREITLKRIFIKQDEIYLEPANIDFIGQSYPHDRVRVEGVLVNLIRSYRAVTSF